MRIITTLRLPWPPRVRSAASAVSIDLFAIELPSASPECLLSKLDSDDTAYIALTLSKLGVLLVTTLGPYVAARVLEAKARHVRARTTSSSAEGAAPSAAASSNRDCEQGEGSSNQRDANAAAEAKRLEERADKAHFIQTICAQFSYATAWQVAIDTLHYSNPHRYSWSLPNALLFFISLALTASVSFICVVYRLKLRAWHLQTGYSASVGSRWAALDRTCVMRRLLATEMVRHDRQLKFLHGRFAGHAPFWQYVRRRAPYICSLPRAIDRDERLRHSRAA